MRISKYNVNLSNNTCYNEAAKFNPLSPERYISGTSTSPTSIYIVCIPELNVPLENNEEFYMYVPDEYHTVARSIILYNGMSGTVMNSDGSEQASISRFRSEYVRLRYEYTEVEEEVNIQFVMCD